MLWKCPPLPALKTLVLMSAYVDMDVSKKQATKLLSVSSIFKLIFGDFSKTTNLLWWQMSLYWWARPCAIRDPDISVEGSTAKKFSSYRPCNPAEFFFSKRKEEPKVGSATWSLRRKLFCRASLDADFWVCDRARSCWSIKYYLWS